MYHFVKPTTKFVFSFVYFLSVLGEVRLQSSSVLLPIHPGFICRRGVKPFSMFCIAAHPSAFSSINKRSKPNQTPLTTFVTPTNYLLNELADY